MSCKSHSKTPLGPREKYLSDTLYITRGALREVVEFITDNVPRRAWLRLVSNKRDPIARATVILQERPLSKAEEMHK